MQRFPLYGYQSEDIPHSPHIRLIYFVAVPGGVVLEPKIRRGSSKYFAPSDLSELTPLGPFYCLRSLELRQLVEDTVRELPVRALIPRSLRARILQPCSTNSLRSK